MMNLACRSHRPNKHRTAGLRRFRRIYLFLLPALTALIGAGCLSSDKPHVTVYCDVDRAVADPLIKQFEEQSRVEVQVVYASPKDVQAGTGLSSRIREEGAGCAADIYWAASPQAMEKLAADGLLQEYRSIESLQIAEPFHDPRFQWTGIGARVRVLLYNTKSVAAGHLPQSIAAAILPQWKGRAAMADPRTNGSANYHLACYLATYGEQEATNLLEKMKANGVQFLPDEAAVVAAVASGKAAWGITDSDLAAGAVLAKKPVNYAAADQVRYSTSDALGKVRNTFPTLGTPALPYPLALLLNRPRTRELEKFTDYIFAAQTGFRLTELQPTILLTRAAASDANPAIVKGKITNPQNLEFALLNLDKIPEIRPQLTLMLQKVLGDTP